MEGFDLTDTHKEIMEKLSKKAQVVLSFSRDEGEEGGTSVLLKGSPLELMYGFAILKHELSKQVPEPMLKMSTDALKDVLEKAGEK